MQDLDRLKSELVASIAAADTLEALEALRVSVLGKKGRVSLMMRELGGMAPDKRKTAGQALNLVKDAVAAAIDARNTALSSAALDARLAAEAIDVSLPARPDVFRDSASLRQISEDAFYVRALRVRACTLSEDETFRTCFAV